MTNSSNLTADTPTAVIFDVDGVLVDSYHAHRRSWQQLAAETGAIMSEGDFSATFGQTSRDIINTFWPVDVIANTSVAALDARKELLFRRIIEQHFPAMPGAVALIDALHAYGWRLAVASSGPSANVHLALNHLDRCDRFAAVVTGEDVTRGKPDPQPFLLAAQRLGCAPRHCVVIEDAPSGIQAAHSAAMKCAALASTGRRPEQLADAELVVTTLSALDPGRLRGLIERPSPSRSQ